MPKKHHKPHRHHKDKSSLKARSHRKPRRDHHHVNQNSLDPIDEASKERVKVDKNACGDCVDSTFVRSRIVEEKANKLKHSRDINSKSVKVDGEKKKKEVGDKDYLKKLEKGFEGKSVRHRSLEKNEDSLLIKTKLLFRKEKSFNDSLRKVTDFKHDADHKALKDERNRKHRSRKTEENHKTDNRVEHTSQKRQHSKKTEQRTPNIDQTEKGEHENSPKRKHKSKDKTSNDKKPIYGGVQEVIYCQMDHVPYKLRNDKNASEIKDLYHRVKKEDKGEKNYRNRSHSHGKNIENYVRSQEKSVEQQLKSEHKKNRERSRPFENATHGKHKAKESISSDKCHIDVNYVDKKDSKMLIKKKHRHKKVSEISLGPYEKYFAFDKKCCSEQCKRHHKQEHTSKSMDRKHEKHRQDSNLEQEHKKRKHSPHKHESAKEQSKVEEEKIHQIVEGDLKTYFCKIQTMIDKKLDAFLEINKPKHEERKKEKEPKEHKRNKSKSKERSVEKNTDRNREKEKAKHSRHENENLNTEKLIKEILRRIKEDEPKFEQSHKNLSPYNNTSCFSNNKYLRKGSYRSNSGGQREEHQEIKAEKCPQGPVNKGSISQHFVFDHTSKVEKSFSGLNPDYRGRHTSKSQQPNKDITHRETRPYEYREPYEINEGRRHSISPKVKSSERSPNPHIDLTFPIKVMCSPAGRNSLELKTRRQPTMKEEQVVLPTATSTSRACSDLHISGSKIIKRKAKISPQQSRRQKIYSASDERLCEKSREDYRRSSSPARYTERVVMEKQQKSKRALHTEHAINENTSGPTNPCAEHLREIPPKYPSKHDISIQGPQSYLQEILLPPENFRCPTDCFYNPQIDQNIRKAPRNDEFIVQGIEPPILECTRNSPRKNPQIRKLECKTVSVVTIPPQPELKELSITNETQTSSKSHKSSTIDRDLVEKRKQSKRFKLYYQYSDGNNSPSPEVNLISSDARSIISDSYKVLSDPSEEPAVIRGHRQRNRRCLKSEVYQVMPNISKKMNRISTPKDSHLNNIMEESSDLSISKQNQDYFVPLRGTRQYYCRVMTSSHSDYCFKIDKKPAISDLSFQSKDPWDEICVFGDAGRNDRADARSRSEFRINPKTGQWRQYLYKSKSDVFLLDETENQYVKSIFHKDIDSFVRDKDKRDSSALKNLLKEKDFAISSCKSCQTVDVKNEAGDTSVDNRKTIIESKHKQFQDIYKTIDILQEGIKTSRVPPKAVDVGVSSTFLGSDQISDKKPQFDAIYKTIDNLEDRVIQANRNEPVEKADAAIGSPAQSRHCTKTKKSISAKQIHDVAVGDSGEELFSEVKSPRSRSVNPPAKAYRQRKSTAISPIRITEEAVTQVSPETLAKTAFTLRTPRPKPYVARQLKQKVAKNIPEEIPPRTVTPKVVGTKKAQSYGITPRAPVVPKKEPPQKSAARPSLQTSERISKPIEVSQKQLQCVKVFRSEERSDSVKRQQSDVQPKAKETNSEIAYDYISQLSAGSNRASSYTGSRTVKARRKESKPVINGDTESYRVYPAAQQKNISSKTPARIVGDSCFHHYPRNTPKTPGVDKTSHLASSTKPLVINTATFTRHPSVQTKIIEIDNRSTASSVGDNLPQTVRRSRSLFELRSHKSRLTNSRSDVCCLHQTFVVKKTDDLFTEEGSSVSNNMEKFTNKPNLRCAGSKSHGTSLDHYIGDKFTSRLFLTKDYKSTELSAYQKRKLYDQSIRQRMKNKFKFSKMDVGPQIFEVRFLSMVNPEHNQQQNDDFSVITSLGKTLRKSKFGRTGNEYGVSTSSTIKSAVVERRLGIENSDALRVKEHNLIFNDSNKIMEIAAECTSVSDMKPKSEKAAQQRNIQECQADEEANIPLAQLHQEKLLSFCRKFFDVNSTMDAEILKNTTCSCIKFSKNCSACRNFLNVVETMYSSLTQYSEPKCSLEANSSNQALTERDTQVVEKDNSKHHLEINSPKTDQVNCRKDSFKVEKIYSASLNKNSSESNQSISPSRVNFSNAAEFPNFKIAEEFDYPILSQPASCPILATNSSSFEFLYEETSSSGHGVASRETVIANLTRPFDQNFNFSTSQYNVETPFIRTGNYESPARSVESGYASINSKSRGANSLTNFFKKPHIAALFKPPVLTKKKSDLCRALSEIGESSYRKPSLYKEMATNCQLYARKVRQRSELPEEKDVDDYQELSLKFLLGDLNSVVLKSKIMKVPSEESILEDANGNVDEDFVELMLDSAERGEECCEVTNKASNHEVTVKPSQSSYYQNGCKLVLSNECLKVDSITYLGPEFFSDEGDCSDSDSNECDNQNSSLSLVVPSKDSDTHNFFTSLIRTYEKELEICNKLYIDDDFTRTLLSAIEEREAEERKKNKKKGKFFRFFSKKATENQVKIEKIESEAEINLEKKASIKLQTLASNTKKCFSMLADAVKMNENINNEIKICGLLRLLERIESGDFFMTQNDDHVSLEENIRTQITSAFINVYELCQREAKKYKKRIAKNQVELIKSFVIKHRIGLLSKTDIVTSYIGRGIIQTEEQLKAAITFLIRSHSHEVDTKEFEKFCKFVM